MMNTDITDPGVYEEFMRLNSLDYGVILCNVKETLEDNWNEQKEQRNRTETHLNRLKSLMAPVKAKIERLMRLVEATNTSCQDMKEVEREQNFNLMLMKAMQLRDANITQIGGEVSKLQRNVEEKHYEADQLRKKTVR